MKSPEGVEEAKIDGGNENELKGVKEEKKDCIIF